MLHFVPHTLPKPVNPALSFSVKCKNCKKLEPFKCGGFPTHDFFMEAHAQIEAMKDTGGLNPLSQYDFQCTACRARWELALPDNAYRGFLRVVSERAQRIGAIRRKHKT